MLKPSPFRPLLALSLGAIAGSLGRYGLGQWVNPILGPDFPLGTLAVNVTGCFILGFFIIIAFSQLIAFHPDLRLLLINGFTGSYTTFATYEIESAQLLAKRDLLMGFAYWGGTVICGLLTLQLGIMLGEWTLKKMTTLE